MLTESATFIVAARRNARHGVTVLSCPYCGKRHHHPAIGSHIGRWFGYAVSDCDRRYCILDISPRCPRTTAAAPSEESVLCLLHDLDLLYDEMLTDPATNAAKRRGAVMLLIAYSINGITDDGIDGILRFWRDNVRARLALIEAEMTEVRRHHPDRVRTSNLKS